MNTLEENNMEDIKLEEVIGNLLETQCKRLGEQLVEIRKGFSATGLDEMDTPEVNIGYGFYHNDHKYFVRVSLEKEFD